MESYDPKLKSGSKAPIDGLFMISFLTLKKQVTTMTNTIFGRALL
jgi:hypothetical protein